MVSKLTKEEGKTCAIEDHASETMEALTRAATSEEAANTSGKMISVRLPEQDKNRLKAIFARSGVTLSGGATMALYYLAELVEAGIVKVGKAGVIDIRDRKRSNHEPEYDR